MAMETTIHKLRPEEAAEQVFRAREQDSVWLDRFTECLAGYREGPAGGTSLAARQSGLRTWCARSECGSLVRQRPPPCSV